MRNPGIELLPKSRALTVCAILAPPEKQFLRWFHARSWAVSFHFDIFVRRVLGNNRELKKRRRRRQRHKPIIALID